MYYREDMIAYFENTTQQALYNDEKLIVYYITPVAGYELHDINRDYIEIDEETGEEILIQGFTEGTISVPSFYDFGLNEKEIFSREVILDEGYNEAVSDAAN